MTEHGPRDGFDFARRRFLGAAAAAAGITLAPGVVLYGIGGGAVEAHGPGEVHGPGEAAAPDVRWGLLVDVSKCATGCDACVTACSREHGLDGFARPATDAQWIRKVEISAPRNGAPRSLPVMCQHCAEPPCVDVCPTGASFKRADGIVLVDKHTCIGCRYCMMACPYNARSFIHEALQDQKPYAPRGKGTVESCTFCVHRVDAGRTPACVEACTAEAGGAMLFGDLNDPDSAISKRVASHATGLIRADLGLDQGVRYENL